MEDARASRRAAITYAGLSLIARLVRSQVDVFHNWYGRRCYERSRGEMITMVYEKTLTRKMIGIRPNSHGEETNEEVIGGNEIQAEPLKTYPKVLWEKLSGVFMSPVRIKQKFFKRQENPEETKQPASMGKILNLMR